MGSWQVTGQLLALVLVLVGCALDGPGDEVPPVEPERTPLQCTTWTDSEPVLDLTNLCERLCIQHGWTAEQHRDDLSRLDVANGIDACTQMAAHYHGRQGAGFSWSGRHYETAIYWLAAIAIAQAEREGDGL